MIAVFFSRNCMISVSTHQMSFNKEKEKLKELLLSASNVDAYDEPQMEALNTTYREYATILKLLYKKQPNVFGNLHKYELSEIKSNKRFIKDSFSEEARQNNFIVFRDSIAHAVERTIEYITDYL